MIKEIQVFVSPFCYSSGVHALSKLETAIEVAVS